jgi:hypothetical protein
MQAHFSGEKYHVEHFTCSECQTLFGPNDSYYEHSGKVCEWQLAGGADKQTVISIILLASL